MIIETFNYELPGTHLALLKNIRVQQSNKTGLFTAKIFICFLGLRMFMVEARQGWTIFKVQACHNWQQRLIEVFKPQVGIEIITTYQLGQPLMWHIISCSKKHTMHELISMSLISSTTKGAINLMEKCNGL